MGKQIFYYISVSVCVRCLCFSVFFILTSADIKTDRDGRPTRLMFDYIEYLETLINKTEDTKLKTEISGLFKQLLPSLNKIINIESRPLRLRKLRKLIPELGDIEKLLNLVEQRSDPKKSYRINKNPFDKELLLTLSDESGGEKNDSSLPPWYPQTSTITTTARPYQVRGSWL